MKCFLFALISIVACGASAMAQDQTRLNFVVFLVDDLGWMDLSCQGSDYYKTPHIDQLAADGMRFTNGYAACAVCSPTRAAVMTGRYPGRLGVTDWIRARFQRGNLGTPEANPTEYVGGKNRKLLCPPNPFWMEHDEVTIAELLKSRGYGTGYIGKWHLGDDDWYPSGQGFDQNKGGCDYGQPPSYFDPFNQPKSKHAMLRDGIPFLPGKKKGQYLTHREADEAVAMIRGWGKEKPFFLQVANYAVHTPIQAIDEVAAKYRAEGKKEVNAKYAAMVESVDDAVGAVVNVLEEKGLTERTVILFTSDNGGLDNGGRPTENAPLRSGKGYPYEGGIRVPFIVKWPGAVKPGTVSHTPVCSIDILPTIAEMADGPVDFQVDGLSLVAHLKSAATEALGRDELYWHFPHYRHAPGPYSIIRKGDWKLIKYWEGTHELFNLKDDPGEKRDLSDSSPEKVAALEQQLLDGLKSMDAKLPRPNPAFVQK